MITVITSVADLRDVLMFGSEGIKLFDDGIEIDAATAAEGLRVGSIFKVIAVK